jgi:hypothetical protein
LVSISILDSDSYHQSSFQFQSLFFNLDPYSKSLPGINFYLWSRTPFSSAFSAGYSLIEQLEKQHTEQQQHLITIPQDILDTKDRINRLLQIILGKMTLVDKSWIDVRRRKEDIKVE